jgi:hypothetical protein
MLLKIFNNFEHDERMTVRKPDTNDAIPIFAICVNNKGVLQWEKYQTDENPG